jgi:hypothetical protein
MAARYLFSFAAIGDPQWGWDGTIQQGITWSPDYDRDRADSVAIATRLKAGIGGKRASFLLRLGDSTDTTHYDDDAIMTDVHNVFGVMNCPNFIEKGNHDKQSDLISINSYTTGVGFGQWAGTNCLSTLSYSFSIGNWSFIGINTATDEDTSANYRIIPNAEVDSLLANCKKHLVVFGHHKFMQTGASYTQTYLKSKLLSNNGNTKIVLNGHEITVLDEVVSGVNCYSIMQVHLARSRNLWFDCYSDGTFIKTEVTGDLKT